MDFKVFYDADADLSLIRNKQVAVIGFGSQGHAHALNLHNSEVPVMVGLAPESNSRQKAQDAGLKVGTPSEAAQWADIVMMLVPDEAMAEIFEKEIKPNLSEGNYLAFAHGLNIHFKKIVAPDGVGVFMVAPKGPGHMVRRQFEQGKGVPCLVATLKDDDQAALDLSLSYARAIGGTRAGVFQTSFREETETDLFGEQAVLCGGLTSLVKAGYETLTENGYSPVMAYFECLHEIKLIVDLMYEGGMAGMRHSISNTAEYGDYVSGPRVIDPEVKKRMQGVLDQITSGEFAENWLQEHRNGSEKFQKMRKDEASHSIETVGQMLRSKMSFHKDS